LQRETTYSQLLNTVNESDSKIEKLKRVNEELTSRLHELQSQSGNVSESDPASAFDVSSETEILQLKNGIAETSRQLAALNERFKKINVVNDKVKIFCNRIWGKLGSITEDDMFKSDGSDMVKQFQCMDTIVTRELSDVASKDELIRKYIEYDHTRFKDISADSVVLKNNRVAHERPESGKNQGEDGRMSNISKGGIGESVADENPEQFHKNAMLDLQEQRSKVIDR